MHIVEDGWNPTHPSKPNCGFGTPLNPHCLGLGFPYVSTANTLSIINSVISMGVNVEATEAPISTECVSANSGEPTLC